ncbi:flagellar hook-length control protein FliK [Lysinibacillus fusiformis]|uniref:flagellar hook-length control protein FliK n=1 Tax=Lysinibacillus fusiformis TaxID=28031 RepID=UPI00088A2B79|nr:flagellar hook-length control protein FliK [Lysinibacillus fusiformis]MCG7434220.1 flagellar hook-length control protein FliK [Lysinibacillus fusiformis]SCX37323.1 flagellar hook-length control protein FliK [Lysinibacillus fusiformis]SDB02891.1 flagellar hook-length control protein FliK [Lysinibacillus fusiformis]SFH70156.1 flagellar hook-length control protein FliK [Lysinibacillus fusiformis]SFS75184.1 flagellar hook-length control protein FliK [Lysinibacillus fusiformis]
MDIAMMKMITQSVPTKNAATKPTTAASSADGKINGTSKQDNLSKFGSVFGQVLSSSAQSNQTAQTTPNNELADLQQVLNADSLEEVLDLLGIPHDDGLLILQLGEDGKAVSMDEMLDLDNILNALGIDDEQLQKIVQQLLGEEKEASDVWELLSLVDAQAPILQGQIGAALQGEGQVTPKEATQLLQVLKLAQLVGQKSDLTAPQENLLTTVKSLLTTLQTQVETIQVTTTKSTGTLSLQGFQQVQMTKQSETSSNEMVTPQTVQTKPDTFQVTLPTAKPAQSEALLKEMQAIINRAQISNAQGITRLTIKLYPENLGTIRIELVQNDGVLTARLLASTAHGREMLDSQAHQLKQAFVQQNIQVDRLDIAQSLQDADRQQRDQNFFNNFFRQQQDEEQQQKTEDDDEEMSFSDYLLNEEV